LDRSDCKEGRQDGKKEGTKGRMRKERVRKEGMKGLKGIERD
jgi:hypothetical protein